MGSDNAQAQMVTVSQGGRKRIDGDTKYAHDAFEEVLMKCRGYLAHHRTDKKARLLIQEIDVFLLAR